MSWTTQPNAAPLSNELLRSLVDSVDPEQSWPPLEIVQRDQHSNDFAEVRLTDGRSLMVKRARYDWAGSRFATSRIASGLMRETAEVTAPAPLPVPHHLESQPIEVYWRIDLPTLQEVWPQLDRRRRQEALRSWGSLVGRIHSVPLTGFGPLADPATGARTLGGFLTDELAGRLHPAVSWEWPAARSVVERLIDMVPEADLRAGGSSRLVHNDLHMGNLLCEHDDAGSRCVGVVDLEAAIAAPPESDLAMMQVHHGPFFGQRITGKWFDSVLEGYPERLDEWTIGFFRTFHLINMGFYSALVGHRWHAGQVARLATSEVERLGG